jgi:hypothetical protein
MDMPLNRIHEKNARVLSENSIRPELA